MNIVNKLTLRHIKKNKRRTMVTIIGVIISVAMLTAVATLAVSFLTLLQKQEIADGGEWHVLYKDVNEEQLKTIQEDKNTESVVLSRDVGYADLAGSENESKPYLFVKEYNEAGFNQFPIELVKGKIPTKENELLISEDIITNAAVDLQIGDDLSLEVGERIGIDEEMNEYEEKDQTDPLQTGEIAETLENKVAVDFTIVGIMERPTWEPISAPGFTVLSYLPDDVLAGHDTIQASVTWDKVSRSAVKEAEQLGDAVSVDEYSFNNSLLRYYGVINEEGLQKTLYSLMAIIMGVIVIGSVSLIYNAFAISVSERSRQLGMLSSVGATKRQKRNSVFFEGIVIGAISIPLGIISGLVGIGITFYFINSLIQDSFGLTEKLTVTITPLSITVACAVSLLTIFISSYIPARRASKVSAIDAIRQTMDVKMTSKRVKTSRFVRKIFGIEAEFGLKNLKRNKRRYVAIVLSLVISIVLFLTVSYFTDQIKQATSYTESGLNYDIVISSSTSTSNEHAFTDSFISSISAINEITGQNFIKEVHVETTLKENQVPEELNKFVEDGEFDASISLYVLDEDNLQAYAEEIGVDHTELTEKDEMTGIIMNKALPAGDKRGETIAIQMNAGDSLEVAYNDWSADKETTLGDVEVVALTDKRPMGVLTEYQGGLTMIVSPATFAQLNKDNQITEVWHSLYLTSSDPLAIHEKLVKLKDDNMHVINHHKIRQEEAQIILLISVFTYGFIALITAISVANIFNTISTSI